jgi:hypothetical protein
MQKSKMHPYLTPCTRINSKWNKHLNVRSEENRENAPQNYSEQWFLGPDPKSTGNESKDRQTRVYQTQKHLQTKGNN